MGANAQTSVPAFTAGQILTAQQQTEINTGIPVFATTTTRDAAFGGTGEKTLAEGQFAYIEASNATQYYDGAAWQTVGGGLTLIKTQTIGSAVSSVTVSDVFSATYDAYKIIVTGGSASGNVGLRLALGATTSGYYQGGYGNSYVGAANTAEINNGASFAVGNGSAGALFVNCEIFSPFAADETTISGLFAAAQTSGAYISFAGYLNTTTSYTSFTFSPLTGTVTGGTIRVYGYQNS